MYHPPLFYALSAALLALVESPSFPARIVLRVVPFVSGLVQVGVAVRLARLLFPGDRLRASVSALAAAFLPVNLYMSSYLSNEPLHGALAAAALLAASRVLLVERVTLAGSVRVGLLLGLAILTKATSLVLAPLVALFLAAKQLLVERRGPLATLACAGGLAGSTAAVAGFFFVRNWLHFGRPVVGNWDVPQSATAWWQHPGFHGPSYYLRFGEGFWDGFYSTLWGDGMIAGIAGWAYRHPLWNYELMASVYALALPATALLLHGFGSLLVSAFREPRLPRRAALALLTTALFVTVFTVLAMTLVHPVYSMTKASYALSVLPVMALSLGEGFARLDAALAARGRSRLRLALHAWALGLVGAIALSFLG
jgi:hypothetical protein